MKKFKRTSLLLLFISLIFLFQKAQSQISEYIYPNQNPSFSNYGGLGIIQNPNSRFHKNGTLSLTWTHYDPYLRGSIVAFPFDWMEVSYQYTDINNFLYSPVKAFSGNQSLKDKSFDAKFRLLKETNFLPSISLGLRDFAGTGVFSSEYIVLSKFLFKNVDVTGGIGWGKLNGNKITNPLKRVSDRFNSRDFDPGQGGKPSVDNYFSGDAGYFMGIEYFIPNFNGSRLKIEYDGTNYKEEGKLPLEQSSKINLGLVYPVSENFFLKLFYSRGNQINFGFSYTLSMGDKNPRKLVKEKRSPIERSDAIKVVTARSDENIYKASLLYLGRKNISLQHAEINDDELHVVISQSRYKNPVISSGRTIDLLDQIAPPKINSFKVSEINGGIGIQSIEVERDAFKRAKKVQTSQLLSEDLQNNAFLYKQDDYEFNPLVPYPKIFSTLGPELRTNIGGPDGFFFGDLKLSLKSELKINRNMNIVSKVSYGLVDNLDELKLKSDSILPHVRSDIVEYMKATRRKPNIFRLQLNRFGQFDESIFYKFSAGILEHMFTGFGGEVLYRPYKSNFSIGAEAWQVYQREYDQLFSLRDYKTRTGHLTFYYQEPKTNILFKLKGGRYLAKDSGITFDFSRIFRSGLRLGGFFTLTDISSEEFGEGSFDKGFYFYVPLEIFSNKYNRQHFGWGLRPLTRDGGQMLVHGYPLHGITDASSNHLYKRNLNDFFD